MKKVKILSLLLIGSFLLFMLNACSDKSDDIPTFASAPTVSSLIEEGWAAFRAKNFEVAVQKFQEANERDALNLDSYVGLGWANMMIKKFTLARANFAKAITFGADNNDVLAACYSGLAGVDLAEGNLAESISNVDMALTYKPDFQLEQEPDINKMDLYLVKAQAHFRMEHYSKSLEFVKMIDPTFLEGNTNIIARTDILNPTLFDSTSVTGNAQLDLSNVPAEVKLISVESIENVGIANAIVTILAVGDGQAWINFFSNPIPRDSYQYRVSYNYAANYGIYLSELSGKLESLKTQLE